MFTWNAIVHVEIVLTPYLVEVVSLLKSNHTMLQLFFEHREIIRDSSGFNIYDFARKTHNTYTFLMTEILLLFEEFSFVRYIFFNYQKIKKSSKSLGMGHFLKEKLCFFNLVDFITFQIDVNHICEHKATSLLCSLGNLQAQLNMI